MWGSVCVCVCVCVCACVCVFACVCVYEGVRVPTISKAILMEVFHRLEQLPPPSVPLSPHSYSSLFSHFSLPLPL